MNPLLRANGREGGRDAAAESDVMDASRSPPAAILRGTVPWLFAAALLAAAGTYLLGTLAAPTFEARATILLAKEYAADGAVPDAARAYAPPLAVATYVELARSDVMLERAFGTPTAVPRTHIDVTAADANLSALLDVRVRATSAALAADRANALADELLAWDVARAEEHARKGVAALLRQVAELEAGRRDTDPAEARWLGVRAAQLREEAAILRTSLAAAATPLTLVRRADAPDEPSGRPPWQLAALAASLTVVAGIGAVLLVRAVREA